MLHGFPFSFIIILYFGSFLCCIFYILYSLQAVCGGIFALVAWLIFIKTGVVDKFVHKYLRERGLLNEDGEEIDGNDEGAQNRNETQQGIMMVPKEEDIDENDNIYSGGDEEIDALNKKPAAIDSDENKKKEDDDGYKSKSKLSAFAKKAAESATYGMKIDITDKDKMGELERAIHEDSEKFHIKTERAFAWLQVCTASLDIFAHGSNDVANAVAPFAAIVAIYENESIVSKSNVPWWILFIGALGMTIGLATYGYKIMQCLGVRMGAMSSTRGYCIELSSAIVVILASYYGYPASTTHAQVGATVGVGLCELTRGNKSKLTWKQVINWKLLAQVFLGWILTLIIAGATCAALFSFMAYSPYAGDAEYVCREYP